MKGMFTTPLGKLLWERDVFIKRMIISTTMRGSAYPVMCRTARGRKAFSWLCFLTFVGTVVLFLVTHNRLVGALGVVFAVLLYLVRSYLAHFNGLASVSFKQELPKLMSAFITYRNTHHTGKLGAELTTALDRAALPDDVAMAYRMILDHDRHTPKAKMLDNPSTFSK